MIEFVHTKASYFEQSVHGHVHRALQRIRVGTFYLLGIGIMKRQYKETAECKNLYDMILELHKRIDSLEDSEFNDDTYSWASR